MMRNQFTRCVGGWPGKGQWAPRFKEGKTTAVVGCPDCGVRGTLEEHTIDVNGNVTPSVMCTDGCTYHESGVVLMGWRNDAAFKPINRMAN